MIVKIEGELYQKCAKASKKYWANEKTGSNFNTGLINSPNDTAKAERTGILGEVAFSQLTGLPYNIRYKKGGDKCDFSVGDHKIDIKTAASNYKANCIRCRTSGGKYVFRDHSIYVGAYILSDDGKSAEINFVGYELGEVIKSFPEKGARARGLHKNYELIHKDLKPMEKLLSFISGEIPFEAL